MEELHSTPSIFPEIQNQQEDAPSPPLNSIVLSGNLTSETSRDNLQNFSSENIQESESTASKVSIPYFTRAEVAEHCTPEDIWVTWCGDVYDVSQVVQKYESNPELIKALLLNAGKDISHWFENKNELKTRVDPRTGLRMPCLEGNVPDLPPLRPLIEEMPVNLPWWNDMKYWIGKL
ncbi:Cytochrome b5 domain-containing protein 1, partial [Coelomomyces lativittatus]